MSLGASRSRPSRSAIALGAVALVGCVVGAGTPVDDGFRVRLAAGCETEKACEDLRMAAVLRRDSCSVLDTRNRPRRDCTAERQDVVAHADLLLRRVQVAMATAAASAAALEERAETARRVELEQAAAADAARAIVEAKEACVADRDARIATLRSALRAASDAQQANRRRAAYIKAHCRTVMVDGSATTRCPAGAPAGTLDATGDVVVDRVPPDLRRAANQAIERSDATHCNDLDANNPNSPELAGAYVEPGEPAPAPVPTAPAPTPGSSSGGGSLRCCDGTLSPSCECSGSHRGCCSHHHGVCGCAN